jgi:hypothetical protein
MHKFYQYVYGLPEVHVESDHKPLEIIFKKKEIENPHAQAENAVMCKL